MRTYLIDTNILLRISIRDDNAQYQKARKMLESIKEQNAIGKVSILAISEYIWTMKSYYNTKPKDSIHAMKKLFSLKYIKPLELIGKDMDDLFEEIESNPLGITDNYFLLLCNKYEWELMTLDKQLERASK